MQYLRHGSTTRLMICLWLLEERLSMPIYCHKICLCDNGYYILICRLFYAKLQIILFFLHDILAVSKIMPTNISRIFNGIDPTLNNLQCIDSMRGCLLDFWFYSKLKIDWPLMILFFHFEKFNFDLIPLKSWMLIKCIHYIIIFTWVI